MDSEEFPSTSLPSLPTGWEYRYLEDLLEPGGLSYGIVQPGQDVPEGVRVVRVKNLRNGRIVSDDILRVTRNIESKYQRTRLRGDEVLLTLVGSVGEAAVVPSSLSGWNVARAIGVIRLSREVSSSWIKLCLLSKTAQSCMRIWQTNTVQATLNLRDVRRIPITMPPEYVRDAITSIASALDARTTLDEKIVDSCDELRTLQLAQYLTKSVKITREAPLSSLAEFINGRAFTKGATGTGRMVVRIAEINSGPGASTVYNDIEVPDQHLVHPGDILFAWSGSLSVTRWFRPEAIINQHIFKVLPRTGIPKWLAFELTKSKLDEFRMIAAGKATTMGHIQRHHLDHLVVAPADDDVGRLDEELGPLWDRALAAEQEALALAELRDVLLPKLMSGELRVRDAEKVVEEVT